MKLVTCKSTRQMTELAAQWLEKCVGQESIRSIFLPAGNTPKELYTWMEKQGKAAFEGKAFLQIDEILTGPKAGEFQRFFRSCLPSFVPQLEWIQLPLRQADAAILGFGRNGHVAFHEPGIEHPFLGGTVSLSIETCRSLQLTPPIEALTYGAESFLATQECLLLVSGQGKSEAFQKFLAQDPSVPASRLHRHSKLTTLVVEPL